MAVRKICKVHYTQFRWMPSFKNASRSAPPTQCFGRVFCSSSGGGVSCLRFVLVCAVPPTTYNITSEHISQECPSPRVSSIPSLALSFCSHSCGPVSVPPNVVPTPQPPSAPTSQPPVTIPNCANVDVSSSLAHTPLPSCMRSAQRRGPRNCRGFRDHGRGLSNGSKSWDV